MLGSTVRRSIIGFTAVAIAITGLTACAGESEAPDASTMTLAQTKSPAQLLRNEAASRIPDTIVDEVAQSTDESTACETVEQDPDGLLRKWDSSVRVVLSEEGGEDVSAIVEDLVASFTDQGWARGSHGGSIIKLTSETSPTTIHISSVAANAEKGTTSIVQLKASGPCVTTEGTESAEVVDLEARD